MLWTLLVLSSFAGDVGLTEVLGWTDEGVAFTATATVYVYPDPTDEDEEPEPQTVTWPLTCVQGTALACWYKDDKTRGEKPSMALGSMADWRTHVAAHPVTHGASARAHQGRTLDLKVEDADASPDAAGWQIMGEGSTVTASLSRGGEQFSTPLEASLTSAWGRTVQVTPQWSTDARRLALFFVDPGGWHMRGPVPPDTTAVVLATTLVTVMAHSSLDSSVTEAAQAQIVTALGPTFQRTDAAKKARDTSVIYFAEGFEGEAKAVAGTLAGGAKTEKISWSSHSDLVVALGNPAP